MKMYDVHEAPFTLHGFADDRRFWRLPENVIDTISPAVSNLARHSSGGRVRFSTDSVSMQIFAELYGESGMSHMPRSGASGIDVFVDGKFKTNVRPATEGKKAYAETVQLPAGRKEITLWLPLYNGLTRLEVGLDDGALLEAAKPYKYTRRVVFYGSSITQGGCASRPANTHPAFCCRWADSDFASLGFSGAALAEDAIVKYISGLDMSVFVLDYDYNAPNPDYLRATHRKFYDTVRAAQPELPIIMISKPSYDYKPEENAECRDIVIATWEAARAAGDGNAFFIDGRAMFGEESRDACTVDGVHPNDLGFYRMAKAIYPVLKGCLGD